MTLIDGDGVHRGLIERVKNILITPKPEWEVIDAEPATVNGIYTRYVCILAAIPPLAQFLGAQLFGFGLPGLVTYKPSLVGSLFTAIGGYVLSLIGVYVIALIIDALAPSFDGQKDKLKAVKVTAYSMTAAWIGGIFNLIPGLGILAVLASLYGLYLLYLGLPRLMKAPEDKALGYTIVSVIAAIVVQAVIAWIVFTVAAALTGMAALTGAASIAAANHGGTVNVGGHRVDLGRLEASAREMEQTARQMQSGEVTSIPAEQLQQVLPPAIGGFQRTSLSADSAGVVGSGASARYESGDASIELQVADSSVGGALAGLMSGIGVTHSEQTATGYEKVGMVGGRMTQEKYDTKTRHGEYGVAVGKRFMVQATGDGVDIEQLKAAVAAVDLGRLDRLAKG